MQVTDFSKGGWMESRKTEITIPVPVDLPMEIKINGLNRDTAGYYMEAMGSAQIIEQNSAMYAHGNGAIHNEIMEQVQEFCEHYGHDISKEELSTIRDVVHKGFLLCDSTYGCETKDWAKHECDAFIIIKGV